MCKYKPRGGLLGANMTALDVESSMKASVPGHFRVWKDVYDSLEHEARARKVSLNTLVNQVLSSHTRDDVLWEEMEYVKLTKIAFRAFLDHVPDGELAELGVALASDTPSTMMLARKGVVDLDAVLDYLRFRSRAGWFSMDESKRNGVTILCFMHEFGPRESVLLRAYFVSLFGLIDVHPKVITSNSSVVIEYLGPLSASGTSLKLSRSGCSSCRLVDPNRSPAYLVEPVLSPC